MSLPHPEWFRRLRTYYASHSSRMFVLHFNVDDYVLNPYPDTKLPVTRMVPLLERYARRYIDDGKGVFRAIFRYSHSLNILIGDANDDVLEQIADPLLGAAVGAAIGGHIGGTAGALVGGAGGAAIGQAAARTSSDQFSADVYKRFNDNIAELPAPERVLRSLEQVLKNPHQRSLVIIEHVENLAPRDMPSPDQIVNAEILKRLATDYEFRSTDNLCVLITRDLNSIDPGIYAPGTNCFPIQIDLPNDEDRATFLQVMERENSEELSENGTGPRRMRRTLISGLAEIDPQLQEMLQRGKLADTRADQINALGKLTQGFRLVEIDQLNRQVRAQYAIDHPPTPPPAPSPAVGAPGYAWATQSSWSTQQQTGRPATATNSFTSSPIRPGDGSVPTQTSPMQSPSPAPPGPIIRMDHIKEHKRRAIEEQSGGLLEIVDVQRGFDAIGGMPVVKNYLRTISYRVLQGTTDPRYDHLIPRGIILAGPPGTGKTIIAEALALESNLNMVKLRNIRQQWVGASERNLTRAFEIIRALSPILVFVDEIDQAFGSRGLGQSSDAGTSERMFGQVLEFIGDDRNRGRAIWVAATNRPDAIDAALLRRFDRTVPCLLPTPEEQLMILEALPKTITMLRYDHVLEQLIAGRDALITDMLAGKQGLVPTGAVIEAIARRAVECAGDRYRRQAKDGDLRVTIDDLRLAIEDYRSNTDLTMYDYQSLLAIKSCNFYSVMPVLPDRSPFSDLVQQRSEAVATDDSPDSMMMPEFWRTNAISYAHLDEKIQEYRRRLGSALQEEGR